MAHESDTTESLDATVYIGLETGLRLTIGEISRLPILPVACRDDAQQQHGAAVAKMLLMKTSGALMRLRRL